jgi:hypothetical protein
MFRFMRDQAEVLTRSIHDRELEIAKLKIQYALEDLEIINDNLDEIEKELSFTDQNLRIYEELKKRNHEKTIKINGK